MVAAKMEDVVFKEVVADVKKALKEKDVRYLLKQKTIWIEAIK